MQDSSNGMLTSWTRVLLSSNSDLIVSLLVPRSAISAWSPHHHPSCPSPTDSFHLQPPGPHSIYSSPSAPPLPTPPKRHFAMLPQLTASLDRYVVVVRCTTWTGSRAYVVGISVHQKGDNTEMQLYRCAVTTRPVNVITVQSVKYIIDLGG